jgi:hypothetical protein
MWRGLQLLLSLVYFNAAYGKISTPEWHTGAVVSGILQHAGLPDFGATALGYGVILLQLVHFHTLFIRRGRRLYLTCLLGMHLFVGVVLGHYLISLLMIGLNLVLLWPNKNDVRPGSEHGRIASAGVS